MQFDKTVTIFSVIGFIKITETSERWPNHDISTLKLLQIVHRHGDRTPSDFTPNDPYKSEYYWPQGIGQLTRTGKYRLYKKGQFIRQEYQQYLGDIYSPIDVYARSSFYPRCNESLYSLLAGAYPTRNRFLQIIYDFGAILGRFWQPFPIESTQSLEDDLVLEEERVCPVVQKEKELIYKRAYLMDFLEKNRRFYENLTRLTGFKTLDIPSAAFPLFDTLNIELNEFNRYWRQVWTKEEQKYIVRQLSQANDLYYRYDWDSPIVQRLRAGGLVKELTKNLNSVLQNQNKRKLYVYSTHDSIVALLMHALNVYNDKQPPYGAALLFEFHEKTKNSSSQSGEYFLRAFYLNETVVNNGKSHSLQWGNCGNQFDCPIDQFFNSTKHLLYEDFDKECNLNE